MTSTITKEKYIIENLIKCGLKKESIMEKCKVCKKFYRGKYELKEHFAIQHKGERWYCEKPGCNKTYKSINGYRYHLHMHHKVACFSSNKCLKCNESFFSNNDLMNHERSMHNAPKLTCEQCKLTFDFKSNLLRHINICKENDKMLKCFACGKRFKRVKYLLEHIKGQHKPPVYECDKCELRFPYRSSLIYHQHKKHRY